jgi:hypothetical protein
MRRLYHLWRSSQILPFRSVTCRTQPTWQSLDGDGEDLAGETVGGEMGEDLVGDGEADPAGADLDGEVVGAVLGFHN